jgi:starch phosphorylase
MLENEIVPLFFDRNKNDVPERWVEYIKKSIAKITPKYTTKRMIDDYIERFYSILGKRCRYLKANSFAKAIEIAAWKKKVVQQWDNITLNSLEVTTSSSPSIGDIFNVQAVIDVKMLNENSLGLEFVMTHIDEKGNQQFDKTKEFDLVKKENNLLYFNLDFCVKQGGTYQYSFRLFPKNEELPHRMDFCYVRWLQPTAMK